DIPTLLRRNRPGCPDRSDRAAGMRSADVEADQGLASGGGVRGWDRVRDRSGHPARFANFAVARKHALHVLDQAWEARGQRLGVLVKYADDLVALCATREQAEEARELVAAVLDT